MKKVLFITMLFILVPSFFVLSIFKEKNKVLEEEKKDVITYIKVKQTNNNKIIELNIEDYVVGVLAGEMPIYFNIEALKAQAVAARTYAMRRINSDNEYDVVDTVMNQVYLDEDELKAKWGSKYTDYVTKIKIAVKETEGEYVDYNGTYADTLFFSTSTGYTENSEEIFGTKVSYLRSVSSEWDEEESPVYQILKNVNRNDFCNILNINCSNININIQDQTSTGRVKKIKINDKIFTGSQLAAILGLRSNYFTFNIKESIIQITTKGFGHGVGMSQYGANGMANNGYTYKEILEHYYQGTTIKKINK